MSDTHEPPKGSGIVLLEPFWYLVASEYNCRGGPPWPPVLACIAGITGGHGGPPLQLYSE